MASALVAFDLLGVFAIGEWRNVDVFVILFRMRANNRTDTDTISCLQMTGSGCQLNATTSQDQAKFILPHLLPKEQDGEHVSVPR